MLEGIRLSIHTNAVIITTGGAECVYHYNTNGGIIANAGVSITFYYNVQLRDMEFAQYIWNSYNIAQLAYPTLVSWWLKAALVKVVFWLIRMATITYSL